MEKQYQVIIVGGGPVGVALALDIGLRGVSCVVVERHLTPQRIPKGQNLSQRSLEHFYFWGIAEELRAARVLPAGFPIGGVTAYKDLMSEYWHAPPGRETVAPYYFQSNERLPQYLTEEVLRRRLDDLPNVTTLFGWNAETISQNDDGVRVTVAEEGGSGRRMLEAEYLVGCDGAHSTVREHAGIEREGSDFDQLMALLVFRSRELNKGLNHLPDKTTYRVLHPDLKGVWRFFGRVDAEEGWFFHAPVPRDATPEDYDFHGLLQEAAGFQFSADIEYIGFWELRVAVATAYRQERLFIAGDAAHSHPPYGAFGLNSGLEDVANLGWKLEAALEGWGGDALLDSYSKERQPVFAQTGEDMIAGGIRSDGAFLERYNPDVNRREFEEAWENTGADGTFHQSAYVPHYEGSSVVMGPTGASCGIHGEYSFAAQAGHHLAPQQLSPGRNVFEELGGSFTLLALGAGDSDVEVLQSSARSSGVPLKVVRDTYDGGRQAYGSRLILIRPDQHVAWAGDTCPPDAARLLRKVCGRGP